MKNIAASVIGLGSFGLSGCLGRRSSGYSEMGVRLIKSNSAMQPENQLDYGLHKTAVSQFDDRVFYFSLAIDRIWRAGT